MWDYLKQPKNNIQIFHIQQHYIIKTLEHTEKLTVMKNSWKVDRFLNIGTSIKKK